MTEAQRATYDSLVTRGIITDKYYDIAKSKVEKAMEKARTQKYPQKPSTTNNFLLESSFLAISLTAFHASGVALWLKVCNHS